MRRFVRLSVCGLSLWLSGCVVADVGRDLTKGTVDTFSPTGRGYRDDANSDGDYVDNFSYVGREGRGDTPMEHQSDRLTNFWTSPKARAIERNVGID